MSGDLAQPPVQPADPAAATKLSRVCLRPADWPEADRRAWEQALAPRRGPFRRDGAAAPRNPYTRRKACSGYGRWLGFLRQTGQLDPAEPPAARPTAARLDAYFAHLRACGNADHTLVGRFTELRAVLQWMHPGTSFRAITHPHDVALQARLPMRRRAPPVPDSAALLDWAEELFRAGLRRSDPRGRRVQVREAVMIALLATRAPRLRACAALRLGRHLRRQGDAWVLEQEPAITKTGKALVLPVSPAVAVLLERYLAVERVELLAGAAHDALWISTAGTPLAAATIARRIRLRTQQRFGVAFGPHRFRASLATTLARAGTAHTLDAAALLGHASPRTTLAHYNRASAEAAAQRHAGRLQRVREAAARACRLAEGAGQREARQEEES